MREDDSSNEELRRTLDASSDPRVVRTRTALTEAVRALTAARSPVTVAALARHAGISRSAFYTHFASLDELALSLSRAEFAHIADSYRHDPGDPQHALRSSQRQLVDHYVTHRGLYSAIAALPVTKESHLANVRAMAELIADDFRRHPARPSCLDPDVAARYTAGAAYGLIDAWLVGDVVLDADDLVEHLFRMLPPWFSRAAEPQTERRNP